MVADLNADGLAKSFADSPETHVQTITANVTIEADWKKVVELAKDKFGGVDILVNNAGMFEARLCRIQSSQFPGTSYKNKPTLEVTEAEFDRVMAVNVKSIFFSIPAVVPAMQARGGGSIINIASIGAMRPRPGLVWYGRLTHF